MFDDEHDFGVRQWTVGGTTVVELTGELDLCAGVLAAARLDAVTAGARPDVVVDLRGVSFMDCSGLSVLIRARKRTLDRGGRFGVVGDSPCVLRLLRLTRTIRVFTVHDDLASALGGAGVPDPPTANGAIA
ncbi:STAS domain-containing protein [Actinacidiphila glaucinigra]|uniref:Anti-sigma factor antagonist n=1 Tax=Actinacidiphila glaucinigra TaxID=235986 RepID=A0A239MMM3_9ACTN|nr:STAS domain-containing protein [Actinacidiphila glaucinigra]SNT43966.1 anti-anti-sigma factor [Actinacidiphila glaucinigra]